MIRHTMRNFTFFTLLAIALCACSAPSSPSVAPAFPDRSTTSVARRPPALHRDRHRSAFSPDAATKAPLLFVSDSGTADVYIYKPPSLKVVATITGFSQPQGECSDNKGNVWIADTNARIMYELSHHGHLVNELADSMGYPVACASDPTTHNLAVMNLFGTGSTSGAILVYANGSGTPTVYTNPAVYAYYFAGYDRSGNLFFDGLDDNGNFLLSELTKGASSAQTITLNGGTIYFPGMVEWNSAKGDLVVGDQSCGNAYVSCVYAVTISKSGGTIGAKTELQNSAGEPVCDLVQGALSGKSNSEIAGSDLDFCGSASSATYLWRYPGGGPPTASNTSTDSAPVGAAISR